MCLLTGVCLRQNVFSMIHLIFLICFPLFQTSKHHNLNGMYGKKIYYLRQQKYLSTPKAQ